MALTTIEWADWVWNVLAGCTRVSQGCLHCYAERMAWRHVLMCRALGRRCKYEGTVHLVGGEPRWTGRLNFDEASLDIPLRRRKPTRWFVNSMSDMFHEKVLDEWLDRMFAVMAMCRQHTFLILTKREDRALAYLTDSGRLDSIDHGAAEEFGVCHTGLEERWPLPNVRLGPSIENQAEAHRFDAVCELGEAGWNTMVSLEPLLGPVTIPARYLALGHRAWPIVGLESGPGARPGDIAWVRQIIEQCRAAGIPVFIKQLGSKPRGWCSWPHHNDRPPKWLDVNGVLPDVSSMPPADLCHAVEEYFWPCAPKLGGGKGGDWSTWPAALADLKVRDFPVGVGV